MGELGKWRFSEVPLEVPFFRLGNGPFAIGVFIVQVKFYSEFSTSKQLNC